MYLLGEVVGSFSDGSYQYADDTWLYFSLLSESHEVVQMLDWGLYWTGKNRIQMQIWGIGGSQVWEPGELPAQNELHCF